jgi:hypothetical protein
MLCRSVHPIEDPMTVNNAIAGPGQPGLGSLLVGIIDRPTSSLRSVTERSGATTWLVPLVILIVCYVPAVVVQAPYNVDLARQQAERQLEQMPAEQQRQAAAQIQTFTSATFLIATGVGTGVITLLVGLAAQSLVLYLGSLVTGGELTYGLLFRISVWSRLPYALSYVALTAFIVVAGRAVHYPGLAALVASGNVMQDSRQPLVALLGSIDLFWLWHLALVAIGVSAARRSRNGAAVGLTLVYTVLSLIVQAAPAMLFAGG